MINILHIYCSNSFGGAEKAMLDIAQAMNNSEFSNVVASPSKSPVSNEAKLLALKHINLNIKGSLDIFGITKLAYLVCVYKIKILHAHQGKVFWPCVFIKWFSFGKVKVIFHRHTQGRHKNFGKLLYSFADKVVAVSKSVAKLLSYEHAVGANKLSVVYGWVDENKFNTNISCVEVKSELNLTNSAVIAAKDGIHSKFYSSTKKVVGTVGAINAPKGKGQEVLIRAAAVLKSEFPAVKYLIVGDGNLRVELQELSKKLGLEREVIFTGFKKDVEKYICAMDIFCLLSWDTEAFGRVSIEAQAMGKPVIATIVGGIPETVLEGKSGFIIEPLNVDALVEKLRLLLCDNSLYNDMAKFVPNFVAQNFSKGNAVEHFGRIYKGLICRK